jgi:tol-pal system protein YbgF
MLNRKALILVVGLWSMATTTQVLAQAQPDNQLLLSLYNQLESLQQEVQTLRGMVEEQGNQLRRTQAEQRDRYLDVDRRLSELSGAAPASSLTPGGPATGALPGATTGTTTLPPATGGVQFPPANDRPPATTPPATFGNAPAPTGGVTITQTPAPAVGQTADAQLGEQDLYRTALNLLLEENQYDESIRLFQSYIDRFPQGRLLTNAYYWQGEALILVERYEQARDVFSHLITNHPEDPKAAGAMLKLGIVYQRMGNTALAEQTWREIATRYPDNATEIRDAQSRLSGQ